MSRRLIVILLVLLSMLLLSACGGGASATPAPTSGSSSAGSSAAGSAAATSAPAAAPTAMPEPTEVPAPTDVPAPTNPPESMTGGSAGCLVGTWQFNDMSAYFTSVMSKAGSVAKYLGQDGTIIYTFGADGKAKLSAQNFKVKMELTVGGASIPMDVNMTGSATASYATSDSNTVTFSSSDISDFKFSITVNGQETSALTGDELAGLGMSSDPKYNTFTYECSADTLQYTPPVANAQPVVLKRVSP